MKTSLHPMPVLSISAAGALLLLAGCSTPATYVESNSSKLVVNVGQINIQDFNQAAATMVASLIDNFINTGQCKSSVTGEPALMAISKIINNTSKQIDTDLLVKNIRIALNRTGRIQFTTSGAEDPMAKELKDAGAFLDDKPSRLPDYTLSGKIIEERAKAGSIRQSTFSFQLSLTSRSGVAVWEDAKEITKQGSSSSVGF
jgi:penicillin-binding protein activator